MNRDYVRSRPAKRKRSPSRAAPRRAAPPPRRIPWLLGILVTALLLGFGFFLYSIKNNAPDPVAPAPQAKSQPKPKPIEEQRPAKEKFDYMTLLENKEVKVDLPEPKPEDPAKPEPQYQMQCGSFRSADQANEMKVKIALAAGISAQVKRTDGANGTWYRVVLGPYKGRRAAQTDMNTLRNAKVVQECGIWLW